MALDAVDPVVVATVTSDTAAAFTTKVAGAPVVCVVPPVIVEGPAVTVDPEAVPAG